LATLASWRFQLSNTKPPRGDLRDRLFQKFASVEAKSRGSRRGHGLGLYVVKLVATAHGGSVAGEPAARRRDGLERLLPDGARADRLTNRRRAASGPVRLR